VHAPILENLKLPVPIAKAAYKEPQRPATSFKKTAKIGFDNIWKEQ